MRSVLTACLGLVLAQGSLWADGVTRTIELVVGGCRVTLAWEFSGKVESDLVIEERFAPGWSVDGATVPFGSLDASWLSGDVVRFAVKPSLLARAGSISYTVVSGAGAAAGTASGDWMMYLNGTRRKGRTVGASALSVPVKTASGDPDAPSQDGADSVRPEATAETPATITSFQMLGGGVGEFSYSGLSASGTLVVEGCVGLDRAWTEVKRVAVPAGPGKVRMELGETGGCNFFRMKFMRGE